jgi:hypothetical protein
VALQALRVSLEPVALSLVELSELLSVMQRQQDSGVVVELAEVGEVTWLRS